MYWIKELRTACASLDAVAHTIERADLMVGMRVQRVDRHGNLHELDAAEIEEMARLQDLARIIQREWIECSHHLNDSPVYI